MAAVDRFLSIDKNLRTETITAANAGADTEIAPRKLIGVSINALAYILFSKDGTDAANTDTLLPAAGIYTFHTWDWTSVSLFAGAANVTCSIFECHNN